MNASTGNPFQRLKTRWILLWSLVGFFGAAIVLGIASGISHDSLDPATQSNLLSVFLYLWILIWIYRKSNAAGIRLSLFFGNLKAVRLRNVFAITAVLYVFATGSLWLIYCPISYYFPRFVEFWVLTQFRDSAASSGHPVANRLLSSLTTVLVAPVIEEIFFRGVLLNRWATRWGLRAGILASSLAFAVLHSDILGSFVIAVSLCILYQGTRTLVATIIVHCLFNSLVLLHRFINDSIAGGHVDYTIDDFRSPSLTSAICILVGTPLVLVYLWRNWPKSGDQPAYLLRSIAASESADFVATAGTDSQDIEEGEAEARETGSRVNLDQL